MQAQYPITRNDNRALWLATAIAVLVVLFLAVIAVRLTATSSAAGRAPVTVSAPRAASNPSVVDTCITVGNHRGC